VSATANVIGAYQASVRVAQVVHSYAPKSSAAKYWASNALAKGATFQTVAKGTTQQVLRATVGSGLLAAQIVAEVYLYARDNLKESVNKNILKSNEYTLKSRESILNALVILAESKCSVISVGCNIIEEEDILKIFNSHPLLTTEYSPYKKIDYRLGKVFSDLMKNAYFLNEYYQVDSFSDLSNDERVHVAIDAFVNFITHEDIELRSYIDATITNGVVWQDVLFGAFKGSSAYSIFDASELKLTLFPYLISSEIGAPDFYKIVYKTAFNAAIAKTHLQALADIGKDVQSLNEAVAENSEVESIQIHGPSSINESSDHQYQLKVMYINQVVANINADQWSLSPNGLATINGVGLVRARAVSDAGQHIVITANLGELEVSKNVYLNDSVVPVKPTTTQVLKNHTETCGEKGSVTTSIHRPSGYVCTFIDEHGQKQSVTVAQLSSHITENLELTNGTLDLEGATLVVDGDFIQTGGQLKLNGGTLVVKGDYRIQTPDETKDSHYSFSSGTLYMRNPDDYILVHGNFVMDSRFYSHGDKHGAYFDQGTLEVKGDFTQLSTANGSYSPQYNFHGLGGFKTVLSGDGLQTVHFEDVSTSFFNILALANDSATGVVFAQGFNAKSLITNDAKLNDLTLYRSWTLSEDITISGDMLMGAGNLNLNGKILTIEGDFIHQAGQLNANGGTLVVKGDYRIQTLDETKDSHYSFSSGTLYMRNPEDYILVHGNFVMDSRYYSSGTKHGAYFDQGTLEVKGDFSQLSTADGGYSPQYNFHGLGDFKTLLSGDGIQNVNFEDPKTSFFNDVEYVNDLENIRTGYDSDGDGQPDFIDTDDDNDGILDFNDAYPHNPDTTLGGNAYVAGDYDGDGKAEIAARNPISGYNYWKELAESDFNEQQFGRVDNDIPINGDFDGDGKADWAVRRRTNQTWYVKQSSDGEIISKRFGVQSSDIPVAADYDGDGKTDFAIRRSSNSTWYILQSSDGKLIQKRFGLQRSDIPVPADYDGDGKADIAIRRPSNGTWYVLRSLDNKVEVTRFGVQANDIPVPADYDGDGNADIAVRRAADRTWYILQSSDKKIRKVRFGIQAADIPVVSDYDGDGKADIAVRRSSSYMWFVLFSRSNEVYSEEFGRSAKLVPLLAPILQRLSMTRNVSAQSKTAKSWAFDDGYEDLLQYKEFTSASDIEFTEQMIYEEEPLAF
jgi:hypothetical protein